MKFCILKKGVSAGLVFVLMCVTGNFVIAQEVAQETGKYEHFGGYSVYALEWPVPPGTKDENNVKDKNPDLGTRDQNEKGIEDLHPGTSKNAVKELHRRLMEKYKILKKAYQRKLKRLTLDYKKEKKRIHKEESEAYQKERERISEECGKRRKRAKTIKEIWAIRRDCHQKIVKAKKEYHERLNERVQILHDQYLVYRAQLMEEFQRYYKQIQKKTLKRHREKHNSKEYDI